MAGLALSAGASATPIEPLFSPIRELRFPSTPGVLVRRLLGAPMRFSAVVIPGTSYVAELRAMEPIDSQAALRSLAELVRQHYLFAERAEQLARQVEEWATGEPFDRIGVQFCSSSLATATP